MGKKILRVRNKTVEDYREEVGKSIPDCVWFGEADTEADGPLILEIEGGPKLEVFSSEWGAIHWGKSPK